MQALQEMSSLKRKFTIDNDLKRHEKALKHLYELNDFDELTSYTQKHELFSFALELYKYQKERLDVLMRLHAEHLNERRSFKKAGISKRSQSSLHFFFFNYYQFSSICKTTYPHSRLIARSILCGVKHYTVRSY
jgi:elongator complex protein 1